MDNSVENSQRSSNQGNSGRRPLVITDDQSQILKQIRNNLQHLKTEEKIDNPLQLISVVSNPSDNQLPVMRQQDFQKGRPPQLHATQNRPPTINGFASNFRGVNTVGSSVNVRDIFFS